jgi:hypothetical protein
VPNLALDQDVQAIVQSRWCFYLNLHFKSKAQTKQVTFINMNTNSCSVFAEEEFHQSRCVLCQQLTFTVKCDLTECHHGYTHSQEISTRLYFSD